MVINYYYIIISGILNLFISCRLIVSGRYVNHCVCNIITIIYDVILLLLLLLLYSERYMYRTTMLIYK